MVATQIVGECLDLRDVMGYTAAETASLLNTSAAAVNSALQRAHALLAAGLPDSDRHRPSGDATELAWSGSAPSLNW